MTPEIIYQIIIAVLFVALVLVSQACGLHEGLAARNSKEVEWLRRRIREIHDDGLGVKLKREDGFDVDE